MRSVQYLGTALFLGAASCPSERTEADVQRFFSAGSQIGHSKDVGLYKKSSLRGEWDLVAAFFGMVDDQDFCEKAAVGLRTQFPSEEYSCRLFGD